MLGGRADNLALRPGVPAPVVGDDLAGSGQITDQGPPRGGGRSGRGNQQDRRAVALLLVVEVAPPGVDEPHRQPLLSLSNAPLVPGPCPLMARRSCPGGHLPVFGGPALVLAISKAIAAVKLASRRTRTRANATAA